MVWLQIGGVIYNMQYLKASLARESKHLEFEYQAAMAAATFVFSRP